MASETRSKILVGLVFLVIGVIAGHQLVPAKVEIREKVVTVKVKDTEKTKTQDVVTVKEKRPDGTVITRTEKKTKTDEVTKTSQSTKSETRTTVDRKGSVHVALLAGRDIGSPLTGPVEYGLHLSKRVLGPLTLGAWGSTRKTVGLSIGMEF